MEQVEGGDLIINRGNETRPKEEDPADAKRDMNAVAGYEAALKLAQVSICSLLVQEVNFMLPSGRPERGRQAQSTARSSGTYDRAKSNNLLLCISSHPTIPDESRSTRVTFSQFRCIACVFSSIPAVFNRPFA
jgi:hypothetical protein